MKQILDFLQVKDFQGEYTKTHNPYLKPRSKMSQKILSDPTFLKGEITTHFMESFMKKQLSDGDV